MDIAELRKRTGLSQSKFAKKFHLNVRTLQTWEQGIRNCPEWTLWMIERILELEEKENTKS